MKIKSITVGGFKNLKQTKLLLSSITPIISTNNYGKSNLLEAIDFGTDFLSFNPKDRKRLMGWVRGIPINKSVANDEFIFDIEFEDESLGDYRYVHYGYSFEWYRDDGTGQRITDEWIEARATESVRYTGYLKRNEGKYRKEKDTPSYRKIILGDGQLAIDILASLDDLAIHPVIAAIKSIDYHVCSSLDLRDRFTSLPIEYVDQKDDGGVAFDDRDVPRALYRLKEQYPDKFSLFLESAYTLFPEFSEISVLPYELRKEAQEIKVFSTDTDGVVSSAGEQSQDSIPFRIRDELYKVIIVHRDLNQPIDMSMMSTGTKRIFWLLANVLIASSNHIPLVGIEELETSIHPRLLKSLLEILDEALENTAVIISSHSPYLVQYFKPDRLYVGMPTSNGTAYFRKVKASKIKNIIKTSHDLEMTVGEYLFDLMAGDQDSSETLAFYLGE